MGPDLVPIAGIVVLFPSIVALTFLVMRYKLKNKELETRGSDPELGREVDALRDELADMREHTRSELAEVQERLDFAERMLTAGRQEDK